MKEEVKTTHFPEIESIPEEIAPENPNLGRSGGYSIVTDKHIRTISWDKGYGGTLTLGGSNNVNGLLTVKDADGNTRVEITSTGIDVINKSPSTSSIRFKDSSETTTSEIYYSEGAGTPTFVLSLPGKAQINASGAPSIHWGDIGYESVLLITGATTIQGTLTLEGNLAADDYNLTCENLYLDQIYGKTAASISCGADFTASGKTLSASVVDATTKFHNAGGDTVVDSSSSSRNVYLKRNGTTKVWVDGSPYFQGYSDESEYVRGTSGRKFWIDSSDTGDITIYKSGGGSKAAIVPTKDGFRSLYCVESPEVWFVDFGRKKRRCWEFWKKESVAVDPLFLEATEPPYYFLPTLQRGIVQVWGKRKGSADKRFEKKTVKEYEENVKFWSTPERRSHGRQRKSGNS